MGAPGRGAAAVPFHPTQKHGRCRRHSRHAVTRAPFSPISLAAARTTTATPFSGTLSRADGDIVPVDAEGRKPKDRRKPRPAISSLRAVKQMRLCRDEIIIATGIKLRSCGVQYWGYRALGIFVERRQKD